MSLRGVKLAWADGEKSIPSAAFANMDGGQ